MASNPNKPIRVRATNKGYYGHLIRKEGDVFIIKNEQAFSEKWMERVDGSSPRVLEERDDSRKATSMRDVKKSPVTHPGKDEEVYEIDEDTEEPYTPEEASMDEPARKKAGRPKGSGKK